MRITNTSINEQPLYFLIYLYISGYHTFRQQSTNCIETEMRKPDLTWLHLICSRKTCCWDEPPIQMVYPLYQSTWCYQITSLNKLCPLIDARISQLKVPLMQKFYYFIYLFCCLRQFFWFHMLVLRSNSVIGNYLNLF